MNDILQLAERCEQATRPDRELDCAIAKASGWRTEIFGQAGHVWLNPQGKREAIPPKYTASLDAAMTLVPEGWTWHVNEVGRAACFKPNDPKPWPRVGGIALTPALALCAAALKARAGQ